MTLPCSFLRPDGTLRALTLWPEWVFAVIFLGKPLENRTWSIPKGEWFGLHAGAYIGGRKGAPAEAEGWEAVANMARRAGWVSAPGLWRCHDFAKGAQTVRRDPTAPLTSRIHGLFRVTAHLHHSAGPWHVPGQIGNVFDYVPLVEPVGCKGFQQLWAVPAEVVERMRVAV